MSFLKNLLGKNRVLNHVVLFGHEASKEGEHGSLVGTWIKEGHRQPITISFFFKGHIRPPKMTPALLEEIWFHAQMTGIDPSHLTCYDDIARPRAARQPAFVAPRAPIRPVPTPEARRHVA